MPEPIFIKEAVTTTHDQSVTIFKKQFHSWADIIMSKLIFVYVHNAREIIKNIWER